MLEAYCYHPDYLPQAMMPETPWLSQWLLPILLLLLISTLCTLVFLHIQKRFRLQPVQSESAMFSATLRLQTTLIEWSDPVTNRRLNQSQQSPQPLTQRIILLQRELKSFLIEWCQYHQLDPSFTLQNESYPISILSGDNWKALLSHLSLDQIVVDALADNKPDEHLCPQDIAQALIEWMLSIQHTGKSVFISKENSLPSAEGLR